MKIYDINSRKVGMLEVYDGSAIFIGAYILQLILQFGLSLMLMMTDVGYEWTKTMAGICILVTINQLALVSMPFLFSKINAFNLVKDSGIKQSINIKQIVALVFVAVFTVIAFAPIANYFVEFIIKTGYNPEGLTTLEISTIPQLFVGLIFMCVLPAFCEELVYRGMLARAFGNKGYVFGIVMSGLLFALMHGNPIQLVHQFFLGVICATVYFMTRSLWSAVIVHFVNNAIAIVGSYVLGYFGVEQEMLWWQNVLLIIVGLVGLGGVLMLLYKVSYQRKLKQISQEVDSQNSSFLVSNNDDIKPARYSRKLRNQVERQLDFLFLDQDQLACYEYDEQLLNDQLEQCTTPEAKEILITTRAEEDNKIKRRNKRSIIYAIVVSLIIWAVNTLINYLQ